MKAASIFLSIVAVSIILSSTLSAQVSDVVGDVADPCIDIVETDISATADHITTEILLADEFCGKSKFQFHAVSFKPGVSLGVHTWISCLPGMDTG